jgi:uncharacterized membrane protein YfcA
MNSFQVIILLIIGLVAGTASGMVGIGGGIIIVPALVYFLGMTQHMAQGTTLAMLTIPVGILGAYNYYQSGNVNLKALVLIACTFVVGSFLGSKFSLSIDQKTLKKIFGYVLLAVSFKMILGK